MLLFYIAMAHVTETNYFIEDSVIVPEHVKKAHAEGKGVELENANRDRKTAIKSHTQNVGE